VAVTGPGAVDTYAYAEVAATDARLTVTLKDRRGARVKDVLGKTCPQVVISAR
jgi:hypothetical protein